MIFCRYLKLWFQFEYENLIVRFWIFPFSCLTADDEILIYDGGDALSPVLAHFCHRQRNAHVLSSAHRLQVSMLSCKASRNWKVSDTRCFCQKHLCWRLQTLSCLEECIIFLSLLLSFEMSFVFFNRLCWARDRRRVCKELASTLLISFSLLIFLHLCNHFCCGTDLVSWTTKFTNF